MSAREMSLEGRRQGRAAGAHEEYPREVPEREVSVRGGGWPAPT